MKRVIVIVLAVAIVLACYSPTAPTVPTYEYEIRYTVTGTASTVNVTLNNSGGNTEQYSDVSVPAEYAYETFDDWFFYISAQNQGETGSVTVRIYYRDDLIEEATSSGAYVIATASGSDL